MGTEKYVFVGIKGTAVALAGSTGEIIWETHLNGDEFVQLVLDGNSLYATTHGEIFCLEPLTGRIRWGNRLKGYGIGIASIAVRHGSAASDLYAATEEAERTQASSQDTIFIS